MFDLAKRNIKRNFKDYALYIGATVFSIIIYFTFATLKYSDNISALESSSQQIKGAMNAASFVLMIFVSIFILYSNNFFMKKRKKEIGLYSLLGVRKKTIALMLFMENMIIGLISLIVGVVLGFILSQGFLIILLKLMGLTFEFEFTFSIAAIINTIIVFFIIFFITSLLGYRVIYRFKLIELFQAAKKGEALPKTSFIAVFIGVASIGSGYYLALQNIVDSIFWQTFMLMMPLIIISLTVFGSYLLFNNVTVYVLHRMKKAKHWSWKGLNMMTAAQLLYRIRANAKTLTVITTLSATTITASGFVFGMYYNAEKQVEQYTPFTMMWQGDAYEETIEDTVGAVTFPVKEVRVEEDGFDTAYYVISSSAFEQLAQAQAWKQEDILTLKDKENGAFLLNPFKDQGMQLSTDKIEGEEITFGIEHEYGEGLFNFDILPGMALVVSDDLFASLTGESMETHAIQLKSMKQPVSLSDKVENAVQAENFSSAIKSYEETVQASGAQLFIGSFLGLVFLLATGSIIFFKMMTEAEEDKGMYDILRKIGVPEKEMKKTIREQMAVIFIAPLALSLLHGGVALVGFSNLIQINIAKPVIIWMIVYAVIFLVYYFITANRFYRAVK